MLKKLLGKLQNCDLTPEEESKLYEQFDEGKKIIEDNQQLRTDMENRLDLLEKDEEKAKRMEALNSKIKDRERKIEKHNKRVNVFSHLYALIVIAGTMMMGVLGALAPLPFPAQVLMPILTCLVGVCGGFPISKFLENEPRKLSEEIYELNQEKLDLIYSISLDNNKTNHNSCNLENKGWHREVDLPQDLKEESQIETF